MGQKGIDRYENQNQASERKYTNSLKSVCTINNCRNYDRI